MASPDHTSSLAPTPPRPENELARLEALRRYHVLDTMPEEAFDRITRITAAVFKAPVALVSLVDSERQWFKSHHGINISETPRDIGFCTHVIMQDDVFVVHDAREDKRFYTNQLVVGAPYIRFYAGAPLVTPDGFKLGTLCAIDFEAHAEVTEVQKSVLADLAALVMDELALYGASRKDKLASQAKSKFLANMSHEIRTPMNVIMGFADMLIDSQLSPAQFQQVQIIKSAGETLVDIINDVLDLSKIEAGHLQIEHIPFSLRTVADEVVAMFSLKAAEKYLPLITEYGPGLPARVVGDPFRLRQVLMNLVSNAVKFTHQGHVKLHLNYDRSTSMLSACVEDTGIGINQENLPRIFEDFTQEDMSITRHYGGTGLGLAITKRLMELMHGQINVESTYGEGTRFSFSLMLPVDETRPADAPPHRHKPLNARILVVEDQPFNQRVARHALEKIGCTVDTASSGLDALRKLKSNPYDVILMDVQMPGMDGHKTTQHIRQMERDLKGQRRHAIIAMTASALTEDRESCLESGMDDFLSKPLQPALLYDMIGKYKRPQP